MEASPIFISEIRTDQVGELVEIAINTFTETFFETNLAEDIENYNARCFTADQFRKEMLDPDSGFYFATFKERIAGYLKVNTGDAQTEPKEEDGLEVERIYVLAEYHGKGVGPALMDFAIEMGKDLGKSYLWLGVWEHNQRAQRFYSKYGMEVFDDHIFMLGDTPQRDLLMRLWL
ncbi:GNAT family N-acetyltransferase [Bacteroidota bacterium]